MKAVCLRVPDPASDDSDRGQVSWRTAGGFGSRERKG